MSTPKRRKRRTYTKSEMERLRGTTRNYMQVVISLLVIAFAVYFLHRETDPIAQKTVFGFVGVVVGYWLK